MINYLNFDTSDYYYLIKNEFRIPRIISEHNINECVYKKYIRRQKHVGLNAWIALQAW